MAKSKALSTKTSNTSLANVPAFMQNSAGRGKEGFRQQDLKLPFLRLAQKLSPLVKSGKAKEGDFIDSLTGKNYGRSVTVVPVVFQFKRMKFEEFKKGGGILCQAPDGQTALEPKGKDAKGKATAICADCVYSQWGAETKGKKQPPECTDQGAYVILIPGDPAPKVLIFQNTSFPAHRTLASMISQSSVDSFGNKYILTSRPKDEYLVMDIEADGFVDEATYKLADSKYAGLVKMFTASGMSAGQVKG